MLSKINQLKRGDEITKLYFFGKIKVSIQYTNHGVYIISAIDTKNNRLICSWYAYTSSKALEFYNETKEDIKDKSYRNYGFYTNFGSVKLYS